MLNLGLIDRYICTANIAEIEPVICINKTDLLSDIEILEEATEYYKDQNIKIVFVSCENNTGFDELKEVLRNKTSVFSGHSGVGKSSIINILMPDLNLKVAEISDVHNKGVHTTTGSRLIQWEFGGNFIDTPGIKTFGLHRKNKADIPRVFPGFREYGLNCKFVDCTHTHEKDCCVLNKLESAEIPEERYESYLRIFDSL
jgi:ribosome biogenesis GTPase